MPAKRVALMIETSNAYARNMLRGIRSYARAHGNWLLYLGGQRRGELARAWLLHWNGDGIIARIETPEIGQAVVASGLPAVDVSAGQYVPELPFVETDDRDIASAAVNHLQLRGLRQFAFSGDPRFPWSNNRRDHFAACVHEAGFTCALHESPPPADSSWKQEFARLVTWLKQLPKPVGVMACCDIRGSEILEACREAGLVVPDEVAVIGVDDDELICELAEPRLSSVIPDAQRLGYEAARLLDRLMAGEDTPPGGYLIPSLGIVTRQSTDMLAVDDPHVATALRFIRNHACEGIKVDDVLQKVSLSRRALELRFKQHTSRTLHQEIQRVQIGCVKELLRQTTLTLETVAHRCGFRSTAYMSVAFKRITGVTPGYS